MADAVTAMHSTRTVESAHRVLDLVRAGIDVDQANIDLALLITGDLSR